MSGFYERMAEAKRISERENEMKPGDIATPNMRGTFRLVGTAHNDGTTQPSGRKILGTWDSWAQAELAYMAARDSGDYTDLDIQRI